ncbi:MAG: hypothetical protein AB7P52_11445 [Alphaproteobacteria bacterium]
MLKMLPNHRIKEIVEAAVRSTLERGSFIRTFAEPILDFEGGDALRITIVIEPNAIDKLTGEAVMNTLAEIQDRLRDEGEERFPIVEYATEEDLASVDDQH